MTKMEMMHVEASEIHIISSYIVPSILICISKCRAYETDESQEGLSAEGLPPRCNTISYDKGTSTCELAFITPATKWESRNAEPSDTTKEVFVRVWYNGTTSIPPCG